MGGNTMNENEMKLCSTHICFSGLEVYIFIADATFFHVFSPTFLLHIRSLRLNHPVCCCQCLCVSSSTCSRQHHGYCSTQYISRRDDASSILCWKCNIYPMLLILPFYQIKSILHQRRKMALCLIILGINKYAQKRSYKLLLSPCPCLKPR